MHQLCVYEQELGTLVITPEFLWLYTMLMTRSMFNFNYSGWSSLLGLVEVFQAMLPFLIDLYIILLIIPLSPLELLTPSLTLCACTAKLWYLVCLCVCVCVCLCITVIAATAFVRLPKLRYRRVIYHDFLDFNQRISLKRFCSRDMVLFAYPD